LLIKKNRFFTVSYYKTVLISLILTALITPIFWVFSHADINWVLFANFISFTGTLILIYPFVTYVYPYMLTKITTFLLTSILTLLSIWINLTIIALALPQTYISEAIFNATLEKILIVGTTYIIAINAITLPFLYQERRVQSFF